jgi:hypothetical protein
MGTRKASRCPEINPLPMSLTAQTPLAQIQMLPGLLAGHLASHLPQIRSNSFSCRTSPGAGRRSTIARICSCSAGSSSAGPSNATSVERHISLPPSVSPGDRPVRHRSRRATSLDSCSSSGMPCCLSNVTTSAIAPREPLDTVHHTSSCWGPRWPSRAFQSQSSKSGRSGSPGRAESPRNRWMRFDETPKLTVKMLVSRLLFTLFWNPMRCQTSSSSRWKRSPF